MDKGLLENLKTAFKEEDYKEIYVFFLRFFKDFQEFRPKLHLMSEILKILNLNLNSLLIKDKEKYVEESIREIYQKAEIFTEANLDDGKKRAFFKNQINKLLLRETDKIESLLTQKEYVDLTIKILTIIFNYFPVEIKKHIKMFYNMSVSGLISENRLNLLIDPLFDKSPKESLGIIIQFLREITQTGKDERTRKITEVIYQLFLSNCSIYPEAYYDNFDFFSENLITFMEEKIRYSLIAQVIYETVENRPDLFILRFFDILILLNKLYLNDNEQYGLEKKRTMYFLESALKILYLNNSFSIFEYFYEAMKEDFDLLFNLMAPRFTLLNDLIYQFFIDYLNYLKFYHYDGKILEKLLGRYLKILNYLEEKGLTDEYFLLSTVNELKLEIIESLQISRNEKDMNEVELRSLYRKIIIELKKIISIVFGEQ